MISKNTKVCAKGQKPSQLEHIPLLALRLTPMKTMNPEWEEKNERFKGRIPFEQGETKDKISIKACVHLPT
jgi:hypothetical protein